MKNLDTINVIKALTDYAKSQNRPVEEIINNYLPELYEIHTNMNNQYHKIDRKILTLEHTISRIEDKIKHQTQKAFWQNTAILIGILGGIAGIIALVLNLIKLNP